MQPCPAARVRLRVLCITALSSVVATAAVASPAGASLRDRDGDGLRNRAELKRWHTDPSKRDSDRDGLGDGAEIRKHKTKPRRKDTDRDRLRDGAEVKRYKTNPRKRDSDGDGLSDWREIKRTRTNPRKKDTDGDGLSDRFEIRRSKTNPRRSDTDGDGAPDGLEILSGTNPRNPASKPPTPAPAPPPPPAPSPPGLPPIPACTTSVANVAAAQSAVAAAAPGAVICLADGNHGAVSLSASKAGTVTLRAQSLGAATIGDVTLSGSNLRVAGFVVNGGVEVKAKSSNMTIDRNNITAGGLVVFLFGDGGTISNVLIGANRISGLGASSGENDLIRLHNFRGVRIENNELRNIEETGGHSDVLQSVHGGAGLIFSRNYVHEQGGTQGFFVKDGPVTNLSLEENLITDDPKANGYAISFYDVTANPADPYYTGYGALVRRNTVWTDPSSVAARAGGNQNVLVDANVFSTKWQCESGSTCTKSGNVEGGSPAFVNAAAGDYRLASGAAGITWQLAAQHYGP